MSANATAADIQAGCWVRLDRWNGVYEWLHVLAARHIAFSEAEPRTTGFVQYDAATGPHGGFVYGGFAAHEQPCRIVHITPQAVTT